MNQEYPKDRKQQSLEDQQRMLRILNRRANNAADHAATPSDAIDAVPKPGQAKAKARSASGSNG